MNKTILFTRPNDDAETVYLHFFSQDLIKEVQTISEHKIINLEGKKVNRIAFEKILNKLKPRLLILNGHGSHDCIYGYKGEIILDKGNIKLIDSKIIYAVACDSLEDLGEIAIDVGKAEAYIGYEASFMIVKDPSKSAMIHRDKNILPFKKVYVMMASSLISGLTVSDAIEKTKGLIASLIREYGVQGIRDKYGDAPLIRLALYWDFHWLGYRGNPQAAF